MAQYTVAQSIGQPSVVDRKYGTLAPLADTENQIPLKFLEPSETDMVYPSHRDLEALADSVKGKAQAAIRYELRLCFKDFLRDGQFTFSTKRFDHVHNARVRVEFVRLLNQVSEVIGKAVPNRKCKPRAFVLPGLSQKCTTDNGSGVPGFSCHPDFLLHLVIPCEWLTVRHLRWSSYCSKNDLPQNLDTDGSSDYGAATRAVHAAMTVPKVLPPGLAPETVARHKAMTEVGVLNIALRKNGRLLHATSNQDKVIRKLSLIDGCPTIECDMHAAYCCFITRDLPPSHSKTKTIRELQSGQWWRQFGPAFEEHMNNLASDGRAYREANGEWMILTDGKFEKASVKVEFNRQCLFWQDGRPESNPLRMVLRKRHYALYSRIVELRNKLTASAFSHTLTKAEGSLIVDDLIPTLHRRGILVRGNNDGIIVASHFAAAAHEAMECIAIQHLGFLPYISLKGVTESDASLSYRS